jgi:hypothetical protein
MAFDVIARSAGCEGGNCPTIRHDRTTGTIRIRGYRPDDRTTELDVEMSASEWAFLVAQISK